MKPWNPAKILKKNAFRFSKTAYPSGSTLSVALVARRNPFIQNAGYQLNTYKNGTGLLRSYLNKQYDVSWQVVRIV